MVSINDGIYWQLFEVLSMQLTHLTGQRSWSAQKYYLIAVFTISGWGLLWLQPWARQSLWGLHSSFAHREQNLSPKSRYDLKSYMFSQSALLPAGAQLLPVLPSEPGAPWIPRQMAPPLASVPTQVWWTESANSQGLLKSTAYNQF